MKLEKKRVPVSVSSYKQIMSLMVALSLFTSSFLAVAPVYAADKAPYGPSINPAFMLPNPTNASIAHGARNELWKHDRNTGAITARSDLGRFDISRDRVSVVDWDEQFKIGYDDFAKALLLQKVTYDKENGDAVLEYTHAILNVELSSTFGRSVIQDKNFILISSTSGIVAIYRPIMKNLVFNATIPDYLVVPAPKVTEEGSVIEQISFVSKFDDAPAGSYEHDVLCQVRHTDGRVESVRINFNDIVSAVGFNLLYDVTSILASHPNPALAAKVVELIADPENQKMLAAYQDEREQTLMKGDTHRSDLLDSATLNIASKLDTNRALKSLSRNQSGRTAFEPSRQQRRDLLLVEPIQNKQNLLDLVDELKEKIPAARSRDFDQDVFANDMNPSAEDIASAERGAVIQQNLLNRFFAKVKSLSLSTFQATVLFGVPIGFGFDALNWHLDGSINNFINEHLTSSEIFQHNWALSRLFLGTSLILSFPPLIYQLCEQYIKFKGLKVGREEFFFDKGLAMYDIANFPGLRWGFWNLALRQPNLYPALESGLPITKAPGVWNSPTASQATQQVNAARLNDYVTGQSAANMKALLIAATIVAQETQSQGDPVDPATLLELFAAGRSQQMKFLIENLATIQSQRAWDTLFSQTVKAVKNLKDESLTDEDIDSIISYRNELSDILNDLGNEYKKAQNLTSYQLAFAKMRANAAKFWAFTSVSVPHYLLFGAAQLDLYRAFKGARLGSRRVYQAKLSYAVDYNVSTIFYSLTMMSSFAAIGSLMMGDFSSISEIKNATEIISSQFGQVLIYGALMGIEQIIGHNPQVALLPDDSYFPAVYSRIDRTKSVKEGGAGKAIDFMSSVRTFGLAFDFNREKSVWSNWKNMMENAIQGASARILIAGVPRVIGLMLVGCLGGGAYQGLKLAVQGMPREADMLIAKYNVYPLGYATVWPFKMGLENAMNNVVDQNLDVLREADHIIDQGLKQKKYELLLEGVLSMQRLYEQGRETLPPELVENPLADGYTDAQLYQYAERLHKYSETKPPLKTVKNPLMSNFLNVIAAGISTIYFSAINHILWNPSKPIGVQILEALFAFGTTFLGIKVVMNLGPKVKSAAKGAWSGMKRSASRCASFVSGKAPAAD